ncbi:TIGR03620 family F420-dependent LLM class oxidoreductase [Pseudonocardia asaccharolytica]|uniref:LLM class F420-dependent oxidoreductase n=1 Tax=Pseudonocardia asaccharolytica DSM 44247 = NBRC 16224 TaxID=1123024 RepID=A0A511D6E5_9PSEU|nr:TIGR03620 family F420-dependent LLM class oxidoreductase [Pseudonocardia asaccharolytica]GEL20359.1 LLM class F420-dependent oxidoreductase [Pseudonocardia asaccharolytica DSM 44247 = NBRC 16224]
MTENQRFAVPPVGLWTGALDTVPAARARELAAELEELGYGTLWVPEVAGRDPFVHLALLLSATRRLIGATGIANIWARDAVATSCATKALIEAFPERVLVGLGVSHQNLVSELRGHNYDKPLTAMRTYLDGIANSPYTAYRPATPTRYVLAALRPRMLRLAAERTEGAHPYFVTPEHTARAREALGAGPLLCPEQAVVLETDPSKARAIGRAYTSVYLSQPNYVSNILELGFDRDDLRDGGTDAFVDALVAWGDEERVCARIRAHLDAGADHVAVQALPAERRGLPEAQWRALAAPLAELACG